MVLPAAGTARRAAAHNFLAASILASMLTREPPPAPLPPPSPTATVAAPDGDTVAGGDTASSSASFPATGATNAAAAPHLSEWFRALTGGGSATALARLPFLFDGGEHGGALRVDLRAARLWETQDDVGFLRLTKLLADDEPPLGADGAASSSSAAMAPPRRAVTPCVGEGAAAWGDAEQLPEVASCCALTLAHVLAAPRADGVIDAAARRRRRRRVVADAVDADAIDAAADAPPPTAPPTASDLARASRGCYARCGRSSATSTRSTTAFVWLSLVRLWPAIGSQVVAQQLRRAASLSNDTAPSRT